MQNSNDHGHQVQEPTYKGALELSMRFFSPPLSKFIALYWLGRS
jgi:hypothetical protein